MRSWWFIVYLSLGLDSGQTYSYKDQEPSKRVSLCAIHLNASTHSCRHEHFRTVCIDLAQFLHRTEIRLRTNILGEPARHVRPLSEAR